MSDWLSNATRLFRGQTETRVSAYELRCGCGHSLVGNRLSIPQSIPCPECQTSHFVLPVSTYPVPKPARQKGLEGWFQGTSSDGAPRDSDLPNTTSDPPDADPSGVELIEAPPRGARGDPSSSTVTGVPRPKTSVGGKSRSTDRRTGAQGKSLSSHAPPPAPVDDKSYPRQTVVTVEGVRLKPGRKGGRVFTTVRLVLVITIAVLATGVWWLNREREKGIAERTMTESGRRAATALEKGDLATAAEEYERVVAAIAFLGRDEPRALAIRQTGRETIATARLSQISLGELVTEAANSLTNLPQNWEQSFRAQYAGGWIVMDAQVTLLPIKKGQLSYNIECPLSVGPTQVRVAGEIVEFGRLPLSHVEPRRVIFAAQLNAFRTKSSTDFEWVIELNPQSGFLWSNPDTLAALGFTVDEETRAVLRQQSDLLGLSQ